MLSSWSKSWRRAPRSAVVLLACIGVATPLDAFALARAKVREKEEVVTPQQAAAGRVDAQEAAKALRQIGNPVAAGMRLDEAAAHWGDPILYMDAAEAWLEAAKEEANVGYLDAATERVHIAVDILYFHLDSGADKNFRMVETSELPGLIARADDLEEQAERLRAELSSGAPAVEATADDEPKKKVKRRNRKADKAMFISGAALTALGGGLMVMGAAGLIMGAVKQNEAERPDVLGSDYDAVAAQGQNANVMAGVGFGLGGAAIAAGVTLMLVSKRKDRPRKRVDEDDRMVRVSPTGSRSAGGVVLTGRF